MSKKMQTTVVYTVWKPTTWQELNKPQEKINRPMCLWERRFQSFRRISPPVKMKKHQKKQRRSGKKLDESSSDDYGSTPKSTIAKVRIDVFKMTSSLFMMISAVEAWLLTMVNNIYTSDFRSSTKSTADIPFCKKYYEKSLLTSLY